MAEVRAYALAVVELPGLGTIPAAGRDRVRELARQAYASSDRPPHASDRLGPIYRRVPGQAVVRVDDPTPADLEALLAGTPTAPGRAAATWRLVEAVTRGLAWASARLDADVPRGLLVPTALPVPPAEGLTVGWCTLAQAVALPDLVGWLGGAAGWTEAAVRAGRPAPDVVCFAGR